MAVVELYGLARIRVMLKNMNQLATGLRCNLNECRFLAQPPCRAYSRT